ncbi:MAG: cadherin repeat domain-containing protein [Bacteroidia bacterium]|nr:cadherin repeat domain-containing protein [Bacteroidia bacterium]
MDIVLSEQILSTGLQASDPVGYLTTLDDDCSGAFRYALVSGLGDGNNDQFQILGNQLLLSIQGSDLNSITSVRIRSTDDCGTSLEKAFTLRLAEDFTWTLAHVDENQAVGSIVGDVDPFLGYPAAIRYAFEGEPSNTFDINPANGQLTVRNSAEIVF